LIIIDVEASGLGPESYPIEVAWQHRYNHKLSDNFLIKPAAEWSHWNEYAERHVHHIPQALLVADGIEIEVATNRLNTALKKQSVYSDAVEYDRRWLRKLFASVGTEMDFQVKSIFGLMHPAKVEAYHRYHSSRAKVHRAADDVSAIVASLNYIAP
tara:strand:- start:93 stop:560 length:468 start_codon:yes stop_codon:yes gene_type:complete